MNNSEKLMIQVEVLTGVEVIASNKFGILFRNKEGLHIVGDAVKFIDSIAEDLISDNIADRTAASYVFNLIKEEIYG